MSIAQSWGVIAAMRVLIGCFEAFIQAGPLYLTFWYKRDQLAKRGSIFFSVIAVAGTMNGVIAYGIEMNLNGARGWPSWRWIFFIEGKRYHVYVPDDTIANPSCAVRDNFHFLWISCHGPASTGSRKVEVGF